MSTPPSPAAALRDPARLVSPRAVWFWRLRASLFALVVVVGSVAGYLATPGRPWWATAALILAPSVVFAWAMVMPGYRYRVHRWEITEDAVFTQSGWLTREQRIAPLTRVQTVDSRQGALQRLFKLASITVTTASAAGPVIIDCLDQEEARQVVAQLTEITSATEGDAT